MKVRVCVAFQKQQNCYYLVNVKLCFNIVSVEFRIAISGGSSEEESEKSPGPTGCFSILSVTGLDTVELY